MPPSPRNERTRSIVRSALLASLLAASAWIVIPAGPVPVTLQVFVVVLTALLLGPGWAAATIATYIALGAAGVPVFSGGRAGLGVLMGPTGGYLTGFLLGAVAGSFVRRAVGERRRLAGDIAAAAVVIAVTYLVGTAQLALVANLSPGAAIAAGAAPFIALDAAKAAAAVIAAGSLRRAGLS